MKLMQIFATAAVAASCATVVAHANQVRRQSPKPMVPVEVALKIAGESYDVKGQASCTHAAKASIYNVLSEMWTVRHEDGPRSVQLTLWKPANGSASMFSFSAAGKKDVAISTVRGGQPAGSGTVTLTPSGKGGTFTIEGKGKEGQAVTGTIKCDAFTPAVAEGGN